jgi:hypothetical protein
LRPPQAMLPLPPEPAPATGAQAPTYQRGPAPSFFLLVLLKGRVLLGLRRGEPQLLAPPVLLAPPLAAPSERTRNARAENKGRKRSSNGEGARWQEQTGGESTRGENGEMLR